MKQERSSFTNRVGFVLAAAGSAVGLGNLWRFPYLAAKYGGGIFLLVYIILAVTFGFALMITEIAIGRKTRLSCIGAYKALDKRFGFLGWLASLVPVIIVPYYCVIGGWVIKYFVEFLSGHGAAVAGDADNFFSTFISASGGGVLASPVPWFILFVLVTALVVLFGVEKGIEKVSRILMPVLVILSIFVAIFSLTMPGAMEGLKYYLLPDFSKFSTTTVLGAMGQLFYSMSLAMGIMITYGSYMPKESYLEHSVAQIEIFDTGIALIAGLMIIPAVVAFNGGDPSAINAGPGLMFVTLPRVFEQMAFGGIIGTAFFLLVLFAALTSSISLMETVVSIVQDKLHWQRRASTVAVTVVVIALGMLSCLGYSDVLAAIKPLGLEFLDFFDFISNSVLMPIVAFLTCILVGHVVGTKVIADEVKGFGGLFRREKLHRVMVRWVAPVLLLVILAGELLKYFGVISI
ncbi:sodium-dependent transporter [Intestinibacillus massiliensis]|uniref:sodium-dependent transporter n=1 Tax=Intestinibacillus massiliensis TaxID=1871029 RepID=UPI000B34E9E3|nr:sodium-dependent transporter [Intestinibacillus massiliensis]MCB6365108.1 sodium-dependent transporter [Intestinibacillus massiliensis]